MKADKGEAKLQMRSPIIAVMPQISLQISILSMKTIQIVRLDFNSNSRRRSNFSFRVRKYAAGRCDDRQQTGIHCGLIGTNVQPLGILALTSVETLARKPSRRPIGTTRQVRIVRERMLLNCRRTGNLLEVRGQGFHFPSGEDAIPAIVCLRGNNFARDPAVGMSVFKDLHLVVSCSDFCATSQFLFSCSTSRVPAAIYVLQDTP
jgi:hypothetical protein